MVVFEDGVAAQERVPPVRRPGASTGRTTSRSIHEVVTRRFRRYLDERRDGQPTSEIDRRAREPRGRRAPGIDPDTGRPRQVRLPAQPARRRRRRAPGRPPRGGARGARASTTSPSAGLAKRLEEVWLPGQPDPVDPAAHQRGALPAAAGARRGAPVRDHLPPAAAVAVDDRAASSTTVPGLGRDPAQGAAASTSARSSGCGRPRVDEVAEVPGIGPRTAEAVVAALRRPRRRRRRPSTSPPVRSSTRDGRRRRSRR